MVLDLRRFLMISLPEPFFELFRVMSVLPGDDHDDCTRREAEHSAICFWHDRLQSWPRKAREKANGASCGADNCVRSHLAESKFTGHFFTLHWSDS